VLALAFFLSSFAISQKKSPNETNGTEAKQNLCAVAPQVVCGKDGKDGKDGQNGKDGRDGLNGDVEVFLYDLFYLSWASSN